MVGISHNQEFGIGCDIAEQLIGQPGIDHGKLIHNDEICIQIVLQVASVIVPCHAQMTVDSRARKPCQLIHAPCCPTSWRSQQDRQVFFLPKIQLVELGIDTDHSIDNSGFSSSRSPSEDKDLVLNGLVNRFFLDGIVVDPQIIFNLLNCLVDFLRVKRSFFTFLQQSTNMTANAFFRKEETVVKDLGVYVLDLVFLDEASQFLGNSCWI